MATINDRIGSQNVIRVLSNASSPPTRLVNLSDVDSNRKAEDGLLLVWDITSEKFVLSDTIDASLIALTGITSFSDNTNSASIDSGSVQLQGGIGIKRNTYIGEALNVTGDTVLQALNVSGITTLASSGGITTTGGDLYVGGDLFVLDDIVYDEVSGRQVNISGVGTFGSLYIGSTEVISASRELKDIVSLDSVTTSTIEAAISNSPNTFTDLNVTGVSTFIGIATFASGMRVFAGVSTFDAGIVASSAKISDLTGGRIVYVGSQGELQDNGNLTFNGSTVSLSGDLTITEGLSVSAGIATFAGDVLFDSTAGSAYDMEWTTSDGRLKIGDSGKLVLGTRADVSVYHNDTDFYLWNTKGNSYIQNTGDVYIRTNNSETSLKAIANQGVELYYDANKKFETTNTGAVVTGTLTADLIDGGSY